MPSFPTPSEYQEAIQFPETAFADEVLQQATPEENVLGLPQPVTGAFAAVFPMQGRGRKWAVKCFLSEVGDQQKRYRAISRHLQEHPLEAMVAFEYQPEGIRVDGRPFPLLKMEWVEGVPLNRFVAEYREQPEVLAELADRWRSLLQELEAADIAHGDLQHGNVLVQERDQGLQIRLVDYDTLYVPALKGRESPEVGHRNYQHPDRSRQDFGPYLDRFAGRVIYTALRACIARPELWPRFDTGENLLFRAADFYDPSTSLLFDELQTLEELNPLVEALQRSCYLEPEAVPSLGGAGAEVDLPAVVPNRRRRERSAAPRNVFEQWALPTGSTVLALVLLLFFTGWWEAALLALLIGSVLLGWSGTIHYRRLPLIRRRRRLRQEVHYYERVIRTLRREIEALEAKREEISGTADERRAQRLAELQEEALYDRLKYHFIGEVRHVEGLSHKVVVRLKAEGIRTAYEATPERLRKIIQMTDETKARITMWRNALVGEYEDEIPETLSPSEERRIQRYIQHRLEDIENNIRRAEEKIEAQRHELQQVEKRMAALPELTPWHYVRYLLRLDTLPRLEQAPPPPAPAVTEPAEKRAQPSANENAPWWRATRSED